MDLAEKFLDIYLTIKPPKETMVGRAKEALGYFLAYGYSKDKEKLLSTALSKPINNGYIRVIVNMLKNNGYIVIDSSNHNKRLSDELLFCRKELFESNKRTFTIGFIQKYD